MREAYLLSDGVHGLLHMGGHVEGNNAGVDDTEVGGTVDNKTAVDDATLVFGSKGRGTNRVIDGLCRSEPQSEPVRGRLVRSSPP